MHAENGPPPITFLMVRPLVGCMSHSLSLNKYVCNTSSLFYLDFLFQDILKDPDGFSNFLIKNLSIPANMTQALLSATVNGSKVRC